MPRGMRMREMRAPYMSEREYPSMGRRRMRDRARGRDMNYAYIDYEGDMARGRGRDRAGSQDYGDYENDMARGRGRDRESGQDYGDYEGDMARGRGRQDGHYPMMRGQEYYPIEVMGRFDGYYGMGDDYARGGRGRDMARGRSYMFDDYGYDYAGDYGETLTKEELQHWNKKMTKEMEEKEKQFFTKENISQKAKQMGVQMDKFNEDELNTASLLTYNTYCMALKPYVGTNMDVYLAMGKAFLTDKNAAVKGGEKLAVYYDSIVEGEDD